MALRIRRGTNSERLGVSPIPGITFALGEIAWVTDTKKLYVGDGATVGGKNILETSVGTGLQFDNTTEQIKVNESYITDLAKSTTTGLFSSGSHSGITFDYGVTPQGVSYISATVSPTESQIDNTRQTVVNMFDLNTDDIVFSYDANSGKFTTTLREERVRYYSRDLFLGGNHQGISFSYQEDFNVLSATLSSNWIRDLIGNNMFPSSPGDTVIFNYDTETKTISASLSGVLTSISQDPSPVLGANLDLGNYSIIGNGSIEINGSLRLNPLSVEPISNTGSIATANQTDWDPVQGVSIFDQSYLVWNNGTNWIPLSDYQQTNVFFVDSLRSHDYNQTGTINSPFKTIAGAILKAVVSGYNVSNPAFIVVMNNITEDVTLTRGGIYLSGVTAADSSSCVKLFGSITINNSQISEDNNQFSISNLYISAPTNYVAITSTGENLQKCILKNVKIEGEYGDWLIQQSNSNSDSEIMIYDSEIYANHTNAINVESGNLFVQRSSINNSFADSNGINLLNQSNATIINSIMNIPNGLGYALKGSRTASLTYDLVRFAPNSTYKISPLNNINLYYPSFIISPTYLVESDFSSIGPNGTINFTITAIDYPLNTELYWAAIGASESDFTDGIIGGPVEVDTNGIFVLTKVISGNILEDKTFSINLLDQNDEILATSLSVNIQV